MPLLRVAILAALQGFSEALPISRSGHGVVARVWLDGDADATVLEGVLHLGTALALLVVARRRLASIVRDGVGAMFRRASSGSAAAQDARLVILASAVSLAVSALVASRFELWAESPAAAGIGLCVTGLALASTTQIPRAGSSSKPAPGPSFGAATIVGLAHGLAAFPGASRVGVAITLLLWLGVRPSRALDLAFLVTVPSLLLAFAQAALARPALGGGAVALGLALAFVSAALASELLRALAERRRVAALALWIVPLGLATIAYAHALPSPS